MPDVATRLAQAIPVRHTDRRPVNDRPLPAASIDAIAGLPRHMPTTLACDLGFFEPESMAGGSSTGRLVIRHSCYPVDPWRLREATLNLDLLAESESILALSNGHIGLRGNLDEGDPHGATGTYLNSFYEVGTVPYAETGYGYPEARETIINVTNGKVMRMLVDDEPFDVRYGELRAHERVLDFRAGTLERRVEWKSPTGKIVRVRSNRLVSFTHRAIAAICYEVESIARSARVIVQSELIANERPSAADDGDRDAVTEFPLDPLEHFDRDATRR